MRFLFLLFCGLIFFPKASAQRAYIDDFTIRGATYLTDQDCFRLTEAEDYTAGSIWYKRPISLAEPFAVELSIMMGCEDRSGADGMVFIMTPQSNQLGYLGEGIGFSGLRPSVGIEIDTWRNYHLDDPAEDHLAIMLNGRVGHANDLAGPNVIPNIEDCRRHSFIVMWNPQVKQLSVRIDGQERIAAQVDLLAVFGGNPQVYWGMSAATGRYNNIHEVCFDRVSYQDEILPVDPGSFPPMRKRWGKD
ncbi:MAG: L-type lectin-domain containing protein [Bacteroidota bacterium]